MSRRILLLAAPIAVALAASGCGDDLGYRFPVHPASGRVVWNGEPVKGALVRFHPVDPQALQPPRGQEGPPLALTTDTDADGAFVMSSYYADDGVPAGDYIVTVTPIDQFAAPPATGATEGFEDSGPHPDDLAPSARRKPVAKPTFAKLYRDPAASPLKATVKPGGENRFTFELDADDARDGRALAARPSE
ncbi:carboxypeptidase-like regulatory domain-containing protein [Planctomyces sp. SH-PL62]|uniref:carboxypeptidase-like regulatory domain-containing protein n=1 Tax=Planctomyces sp. SH-PL62 TaxID=1636152 RepID=UPI00078D3260|nr:carboxypeptidase-like regulatory domain-containing protein [Planctomyces sp. SH-PL62]AMV40774.1 hypothetical protein VT85_25300 [Planctomyces sp. SH-PL62]